ncbi:MAG TPA: DUF1540 domain-containing protein [Tichowtungia sp.]|nr:DUF1540 domain-containing protein [Tichowtungia sp.]HKL27435.1 DUF1540 domain-containing protein [Desulfuromonadales bacterium]
MAMKMPKVTACTVEKCSYNKDQSCRALAITIGDPGGEPACDTYFPALQQGGVMDATAGVGACKAADCKFNQDFECAAESISVGLQRNDPDCLTYKSG